LAALDCSCDRVRRLAGVLAIALVMHVVGSRSVGAPGEEARDARPTEPGDKVAFARGDIWILTSGATQPQRLTSSGNGRSPAWSPDGRRLVCLSNRKLWVIDTVTDERTCLYAGTDASGPTWSPDGNTIVFGRFPELGDTQTGTGREEGIWAADPEGANLRRLLSYAAPEAAPSVRGELWAEWEPHLLDHFAFSPDGRLLAFAYEGESSVLFVATLDGASAPTRAEVTARSEVSATDYCWLGDSQHLLVADGGAEGYVGSGLNVVEATTGKAEVVLPHPFGVHQVAYSASAHTAAVNWPDGDSYTDQPPWTKDDVCLVEMLDGRVRSGRESVGWGSGIVAAARFRGQHVADLQLAHDAQTVYVLAEDASRDLYRVTRGGTRALLGEGVRDFAVWSPAD
jgi:hypothetical protein